MSALHSLGLDAAFENPAILGEGVSLYQWMINRIKSDNLTCSVVTNGLVHDLFCRVHIKKSRHDQHDLGFGPVEWVGDDLKVLIGFNMKNNYRFIWSNLVIL